MSAALVQPLIPGNRESRSDKCFIGQHFTETVSSAGPPVWHDPNNLLA